MIRTMTLVLLVLAQVPAVAAAASCDGANPVVTTVTLQSVGKTPYLNLYHLTATVTNRGNQAQAGNALQFVDIVQYGGRLDDRGVPPLGPGESYTVNYIWPRSADAGKGTSPLDFRIRSVAPMTDSCTPGKGSAGITV
jgi:CARDB